MLSWTVYPLFAWLIYWFYKRVTEDLNTSEPYQSKDIEEDTILYGTKFDYVPFEVKKEPVIKTAPNTPEATEDYQRLQTYMDDKRTYMQSQTWNQKRIDRLDIDNYTCQKCGLNGLALDVHHIRYTNIPTEPLDDLISLCSSRNGHIGCHEKLHNKVGYPSTYKDYMTKYYWYDIN